jgi:pseudouridine-5'-phosphate glycosidase
MRRRYVTALGLSRGNGRRGARAGFGSPCDHVRTVGTCTVHPEVRQALHEGRAVVALESTIISHGMPYPANIECAREVEARVRESGAVPATCAIIGGQPLVGLDGAALEQLAQGGLAVRKCSRRDLASVVAAGGDGATTVAGTMVLAHMAGIEIFATGGIGGVHRGAELSFDVSADLTELGRTPMAVVCAGVKSILDIGLTLEYLETQGVAVATMNTSIFPAFFTTDSGFESPNSLWSVKEAARQLHASTTLGLQSGTLIAVPNPSPAADSAALEAAVLQALAEAKAGGIEGKHVTPFLLSRVTELTGGDSLASNIELVSTPPHPCHRTVPCACLSAGVCMLTRRTNQIAAAAL